MIAENKKYDRVDDYILVKTLGAGVNSEVKLAYNSEDGQYYALKLIKTTTNIESNKKAMLAEYNVLSQLEHKNIVRLYSMSNDGAMTTSDGKTSKVMYAVIQLA